MTGIAKLAKLQALWLSEVREIEQQHRPWVQSRESMRPGQSTGAERGSKCGPLRRGHPENLICAKTGLLAHGGPSQTADLRNRQSFMRLGGSFGWTGHVLSQSFVDYASATWFAG